MMRGTAVLVLDMGNSSTKFTIMFGKEENGNVRYKERTLELDNTFANLPDNYIVPDSYSHKDSTVLRITNIVQPEDSVELEGLYCNGLLQKHEKPDAMIKPHAQTPKWKLASSQLTLRLVFLRAFYAIMDMLHITDPTQLSLTWKVITLLPPGMYTVGKDKLISVIKSIDKVESVYPELTLPITIESVTVFPEGFGAYVSVVYDKGNVYRKGYTHLCKTTLLVIDIGGGTTDIVVIKDNKIVQDSCYSITLGGNNVLSQVRRGLMCNLGLTLDEDDIKQGILKGYVMDGTKREDISEIINEARKDVSAKIVSEFNNYLEGTSVKMRSISHVLLCGGGSMDSANANTISLVDSIVSNLKELAPNCEAVKLPSKPQKVVKEDGEVEVKTVSFEPRMLNLIGAGILAEIVR